MSISIFSGKFKGSIETGFLGDSYFSPAPSTLDETTKKAVLLCTDGSGLALPNCKFIADELARRLECDVWIPDYFLGKRTSRTRLYLLAMNYRDS